jgi:hypothetical protein
MTPQEFDDALAALAWKGTDFCHRVGLVPNTVWRWRKGAVAIPLWVGEYLRAMLAIQRLQNEFVAVRKVPGAVATEADDATVPDGDAEDQKQGVAAR